MDYSDTVVIDCGSRMCKTGIQAYEPPTCFKSFIGRPKYQLFGSQKIIGDQDMKVKGAYMLNYPIENGVTTNFEDLTSIWRYCFQNKLNFNPQEHPVLITQSQKQSKISRQKKIQIMFEQLKVPGFFMAYQSVLGLFSTGRSIGVCLDIGAGLTQAFPLYEGFVFPQVGYRKDDLAINLAGNDITQSLRYSLIERGLNFSSSYEKQNLCEMKQKTSYVALDYQSQFQNYTNSSKLLKYQLPDGSVINLGNQRFRCTQTLFNPLQLGKNLPGLHQFLYNAINMCNEDGKKEIYQNIVLAGGSSQIPGLQQRLRKYMYDMAPINTKIKIRRNIETKDAAFHGGVIMGNISSFKNQIMIKKSQYEQSGPHIVHRKCY